MPTGTVKGFWYFSAFWIKIEWYTEKVHWHTITYQRHTLGQVFEMFSCRPMTRSCCGRVFNRGQSVPNPGKDWTVWVPLPSLWGFSQRSQQRFLLLKEKYGSGVIKTHVGPWVSKCSSLEPVMGGMDTPCTPPREGTELSSHLVTYGC